MYAPFRRTPIYDAVIFALSPQRHQSEVSAVYICEGVVQPINIESRFANSHSLVAVSTYPKERIAKVSIKSFEGRNSREVLDFNLFLSPSEVWNTASVIPTELDRVREGYFEILEKPLLVLPFKDYAHKDFKPLLTASQGPVVVVFPKVSPEPIDLADLSIDIMDTDWIITTAGLINKKDE